MARSLNQVQLIGNLTRDPELRYTPTGTAVVTFGLATNRSWTTDTGEKHEETEFHRIVAWKKLAEICSQFLTKGRKVYVEGRLSTRTWKTQEGQDRSTTEIVIDDMILLDNKGGTKSESEQSPEEEKPQAVKVSKSAVAKEKVEPEVKKVEKEAEVSIADIPDDIPF